MSNQKEIAAAARAATERALSQGKTDRNFLFADWSHNNKRFRLKQDPAVVVDVTRNVDESSILLGTWKWVGPDGIEHGPLIKLDDVLRDMNRCFRLAQNSNPRQHWRGCARKVGGTRLRLVPLE